MAATFVKTVSASDSVTVYTPTWSAIALGIKTAKESVAEESASIKGERKVPDKSALLMLIVRSLGRLQHASTSGVRPIVIGSESYSP